MSKLTKILLLISAFLIVFIIFTLTVLKPFSSSTEEVDTNTIFKEASDTSLTFTDAFGESTYKLSDIVNIYCVDEFKTDEVISVDNSSFLSEITANKVRDEIKSGEQISFFLSGDVENTESYTIMSIFKKCRIVN